MENREILVDEKTSTVSPALHEQLGGFCHILHGSSKKSKRVGVSTSYKEAVAAVTGQEIAQLVVMRYTEILGAGYTHILSAARHRFVI